jgi:hypothetical protein
MKALFAQFRSSKNPHLRAAGNRASVLGGGDHALAQFEQTALTQTASERAAVTEEIKYYLAATDPLVVAQLGRFARSETSPAELRKASLTALARSHTRESLPYLAGFLDHPDAEMRSLAVGGLAMFANNVPAGQHHVAPGDWKYRTDETIRNSAMDATIIQNTPSIVAFWKSWWAQHQAELK